MQIIIGIILLVLGYFLKKIICHVVRIYNHATALERFPMDPKHILWGHLHTFPGFNEAGLEFMRKRTSRFPKLCTFWAGNYLRGDLLLYHPDNVGTLLKTTEPKPMTVGTYKYGKVWLGDGLILSSGAKWSRNRRLLTNVFHFEALKQYLKVKNSCTEVFMNNLLPFAESGESFEIFDKISLLTFDIILRCAFSYDNDVQIKGYLHPYLQAVTTLQNLWIERIFIPWYYSDIIYWFSKDSREYKKNADFVHNISESLIKERRNLHEMSLQTLHNDFLEILMTARDENGTGLSYSEIRDEVDTFLFAGHDTTSSAISWTLFSLAGHPKEQIQCQNEIDEIMQGRTDDTLKWDDLTKLQYLGMCIKEALRLHCPVPDIGRELEKPMVFDGIEMPAGSPVSVSIYSLHHNSSLWSDSLKYDPNRFSPENIAKMNPYSFIPFSAGPRNCIGQNFAMNEIKLIVARTLKRFSLTLDTERPVKYKPRIVMRTENGMFMKCSKRD